MTTSNYKKVFKQLKSKPAKLKKFKKFNKPKERSCGKAKYECRFCGSHNGLIRKYGLNICRQCFKEKAHSLGFKKFR